MDTAPKNHKLTSLTIQKDLISSYSFMISKAIVEEIGNSFFALLVDEAHDSSMKEQMAIAFRYVNKEGCVIEHFLGVVHVSDTTAQLLKKSIDAFFSSRGLNMSRCHGQGYDGASNMQGEFNGLKSLILQENGCAYYVHCFAHQLQLTPDAIAKKVEMLQSFFWLLNMFSNIVCGSCKWKDMLLANHHDKIIEGINCGELETGRGLNQETTLRRPGETCWGSQYATVVSVIKLYPSVLDLLKAIREDAKSYEEKSEAHIVRSQMVGYEFLFVLHLMKFVLRYTSELSQALQRKDQDLVNAMTLVTLAKQRLQIFRDEGWGSLLNEVNAFAMKNEISILQMDEEFIIPSNKRQKLNQRQIFITTKLRYLTVLDYQLKELNERFDNTNTELLRCIACLDPRNSFATFDKRKLVEFARFYPQEFDEVREIIPLENHLETFIMDMKSNEDFQQLNGISELVQNMVVKGKDVVYLMVFLLIKLALILPVAIATVEWAFSTMKIVKNDLRNRMGDEFLNDAMLYYIENEIFDSIDDMATMEHFQNMKNRR